MPQDTPTPAAPKAPERDPFDLGDRDLEPPVEMPSRPRQAATPAGQNVATLPPEPPSERDATRHSDRSLRLAEEFGFGDSDVKSMTPAELDAAVHQTALFLARHQRELRDQAATRASLEGQGRPTPPAPAPPAPAPEDELGLDPEQYDPGLVAAFRKLHQQNKELREQLGQTAGALRRRESVTAAEVFDAAFDSLGASYERLFGKGTGEELKGTAELKRRLYVLRAAGVDVSQDTARAVARKVKAAAEELYGPVAAAPPPAPPADDPYGGVAGGPAPRPERPRNPDGTFMSDAELRARQAWDDGGLARPTHRSGAAEPDGKDKATRNLGNRMRELGLGDGRANGEAGPGDFLS